MTTSQRTSILSELSDNGALSTDALAYFRERHRLRLYEVVTKQFLRSEMTKADLARRMGRKAEQITRWLGAPGNWTLDTLSDLLLAISGTELEFLVSRPLVSTESDSSQRHSEALAATLKDLYRDQMNYTAPGPATSLGILNVADARAAGALRGATASAEHVETARLRFQATNENIPLRASAAWLARAGGGASPSGLVA